MRPVGVLALQGDVREHLSVLGQINVDAIEVRKPSQLQEISGLIIPGGESTVIDKLSHIFGLYEPIKNAIQSGLPVFGTCAGLILLSDRLVGATKTQKTFGGLNATVQRNAFGTQLDSFETTLKFADLDAVSAAFIRAPVVIEVGSNVSVLSKLTDGKIVAIRSGNLLGTSFHPEIIGETRVHEYFVEMCKTAIDPKSN